MGTNGGLSALVKGEERVGSGKERGRPRGEVGRRVQRWAEQVKRSREEIRLTSVTVAGGGRVQYGSVWEGRLGVPGRPLGG